MRRQNGNAATVQRVRDNAHANADVVVVASDPGTLHGRRPTSDAALPVHRHRVRSSHRSLRPAGRRLRVSHSKSEGPRHDCDRQSSGRPRRVHRLRTRERRRSCCVDFRVLHRRKSALASAEPLVANMSH